LAFIGVATLASQDEELYRAGVKAYWNDYQNELFEMIDTFDEFGETLTDSELISAYVTELNNPYSEDTINKARQIQVEILTKLADGNDEPYTPDLAYINYESQIADMASTKTATYTVVSGDTVWDIAQSQLGDGNRYKEIYEPNKVLLTIPDMIHVGDELVLPLS
jgi:nucleoid-associated protein YgaU